MKFAEIQGYLSPWYRVCTETKFIRKGNYGYSEHKNVNIESVPKGFLRVRACKLLGLMQRRIRPTIEICGNSGLPFSIIPCLHQSKVYMKRKLRDGEPKSVILESVQKGYLRVRACKLQGFMQRRTRPTKEIFGNLGHPFSLVPCVRQNKVYMKRMLRVSRA